MDNLKGFIKQLKRHYVKKRGMLNELQTDNEMAGLNRIQDGWNTRNQNTQNRQNINMNTQEHTEREIESATDMPVISIRTETDIPNTSIQIISNKSQNRNNREKENEIPRGDNVNLVNLVNLENVLQRDNTENSITENETERNIYEDEIHRENTDNFEITEGIQSTQLWKLRSEGMNLNTKVQIE